MPTKFPALAGLGALALGGVLVVLGLDEAPVLVRVGVAVGWLGVVLAVATVLLVLRQVHRAGHRTQRSLRGLERALGDGGDGGDLLTRLDELERSVARALRDHEREVLRVVDVRLLALQQQLHDAGRSPGP